MEWLDETVGQGFESWNLQHTLKSLYSSHSTWELMRTMVILTSILTRINILTQLRFKYQAEAITLRSCDVDQSDVNTDCYE